MSGELQQAVRRQQQTEELCGAAIRALSAQGGLRYRDGQLLRGDTVIPVRVPHLQLEDEHGFTDLRGVADGLALRQLYSDARLHAELAPVETMPRMLFDLQEQLRTEALAPTHLKGLRRNLERRFVAWSHSFYHAGLTETHTGILLYTLIQMCWSRLNGRPVVDETEDLIEATRAGLARDVGRDLAGLRRHLDDQAAYATHALAIAEIISRMIEDEGDPQDDEASDQTTPPLVRAAFNPQNYEETGEEAVEVPMPVSGLSKVLADAAHGYRAFSTAYDREVQAATLVRPALLLELREDLDRLIREQGINLPRLARRLLAVLSRPVRDDWRFGQDEGYLDGRRLHQLVTSDSERRVFKRERWVPQADSIVTLLIDCSGSMKAHMQRVAVLVDVLGRALQLAGVRSEILGFTTGAWNGGRVYQDWVRQRKPDHPGRLNEVTHLVYKSIDTSWRRARPNIAALLKADLFREGVDGEALLWAASRMQGHSEQRRILCVISDGSPMDSATQLANDDFYLDNHLKSVVSGLSGRRGGEGVEVYGLGVGLDLSPYYRRCLALDLSEGISHRVFDEFITMISQPS